MASSGSVSKMSEEFFEYICTSCAKGDLIKEALKYCVECQQYCCQECLTSHERISALKGHSFLDNSSVKPKGHPKSLPAFPTKQCSKHAGKIMDMFCDYHDEVCCYVCAAEDHKSCKNIVSISDNIDQLYSKTDTHKATAELSNTLGSMNQWQTNTDELLQQLQDSKDTAIKDAREFRLEMEHFLKELEEASIKKIKDEYKKLETLILEERKRCEDFINDLRGLQQLIVQASGNIAQLFVCSKIAEMKCSTVGDDAKKRGRFNRAEIKFISTEEIKCIKKMKHLGETSAISTRTYNTYKATKICDMNVKLKNDSFFMKCLIFGAYIYDDTVLFTDHWNNKLKRFDIASLSLIEFCDLPRRPYGICKVKENVVAVACLNVVQFVSIHDKLSLLHAIKMNHKCYGIAHRNDRLYISDESKSIYMYDMSGNLLKTVTTDNRGQPLFECSNHVLFNNERLFVGDSKKGLVCFNAQCDYIETIKDPDVKSVGVCMDLYDNVIVANFDKRSIVQCGRDGRKFREIVKTHNSPWCVCIHSGFKKMFVCYFGSNTVEVYNIEGSYRF